MQSGGCIAELWPPPSHKRVGFLAIGEDSKMKSPCSGSEYCCITIAGGGRAKKGSCLHSLLMPLAGHCANKTAGMANPGLSRPRGGGLPYEPLPSHTASLPVSNHTQQWASFRTTLTGSFFGVPEALRPVAASFKMRTAQLMGLPIGYLLPDGHSCPPSIAITLFSASQSHTNLPGLQGLSARQLELASMASVQHSSSDSCKREGKKTHKLVILLNFQLHLNSSPYQSTAHFNRVDVYI